MNKKYSLITLAAAITMSAVASTPANAWGFGDVSNAINNAANQASNTANQAADTAQQAVHDTAAAANQAAGQFNQGVAGNNNGGTFGAHFGADIPNPVRGAVSGFQQAGQEMRNVGTQIGRQAGDAYSNLERQPGVSVGFNGSFDVNDKHYGGGRSYNIDNPLPGMRRDAETARERANDTYNTVADKARQIGSQTGRTIQDEYTRMENMPGANFGGNAGVNVNGRQYGIGGNIEVNNPMRGFRQAGQEAFGNMNEQGREMASNIRRHGGDAFNQIENVPGLSVSADYNRRAGRGGVSVNAEAGVNPYYGQNLQARAQFGRSRQGQVRF